MVISFDGGFGRNGKRRLRDISRGMIKGAAQIYQAGGAQIMVEF